MVLGGALVTIVFTGLPCGFGIGILSMFPIFILPISIFFPSVVPLGICIPACLPAGGLPAVLGFSFINFMPHMGQLPGLAAWVWGGITQGYVVGCTASFL